MKSSFLRFFVPLLVMAATLDAPAGASTRPDDGLQLYYPFDGNALDASGNNNNGNVSGAKLTRDRNGVKRSAYKFQSPEDKIVAAYSDSLEPPLISVVAWVKVKERVKDARIIDNSHEQSKMNQGYYMSLGGFDKFIQFCVYIDTGSLMCAPVAPPKREKAWHFYVGTFDGSELRMYVDGELRHVVGFGAHAIVPAHQGFAVGNNADGTAPFSGAVDEVRVYDRPLSDDEVMGLFQSGLLFLHESQATP